MTPKQKAEQLVALFEITAHPTIDMDKQISKTCALKCVNEIKQQIGKYYHEVKVSGVIGIDGYFQKQLDFFNEIHKQIEIL